MSGLSTVDAVGLKALLGEKGEGIEVAWIEALMAAGCEISFYPFSKADIERAADPTIKPLFLTPKI